jgi:hypothetical protein
MIDQTLPLGCNQNSARRAFEDRHAEPGLQLSDLGRQGGLRNPAMLGRPHKAAVIRD